MAAGLRQLGRGQSGRQGAATSGWSTNELSPGWEDALPSWSADPKGIATRAASGKVLTAIAPKMPELWGGSADLAESNNTTPEGEPSFLPADRQTKDCSAAARTAGCCTSASASTPWARS